MLGELLARARAGEPLWLCDVRERFAAARDGVPLVLRLRSFDGVTRDWTHHIPPWRGEEERCFVRDYLCASVYNAMSACGGFELAFYVDPQAKDIVDLLNEIPHLFQIDSKERHGLGKVVSIANRMSTAFGCKHFSFTICDIGDCIPISKQREVPASPVRSLRALADACHSASCVGIDVGGSDIKLAAASRGQLVAVKEYNWNPASYPTIDRIIDPILLLTRLMRACIAADGTDEALLHALRTEADDAEIARAVAHAEARRGVGVLDAVGVSFPDIVLRDRIVGGETPKTDALRRNAAVDYETEFAKLGALKENLLALCRHGGVCRLANDGSMAAFTAAMELACGGASESVANGVIAHSLGTDLGTGWLDERGELPQLPLELYDLWLDLGSFPTAALPPDDLRSTRNGNSGLPGVRRCLGQSAAFRLAWELAPKLLDGFTEETDGILRVRTEPDDLRKPCLEHLMRLAAAGDSAAEEIFRRIGRNLAVVCRETEYLLHPKTDVRFLFGRFVKSDRCFALLQEGFAQGGAGHVRLENGGEGLAETPLMRQLAQRRDVTVAQFAQAVGALYFAFSGGMT